MIERKKKWIRDIREKKISFETSQDKQTKCDISCSFNCKITSHKLRSMKLNLTS